MNKGETRENGKREQEARDAMGLRAKMLCQMLGYEGCVNAGGKKFNKLFISAVSDSTFPYHGLINNLRRPYMSHVAEKSVFILDHWHGVTRVRTPAYPF